jgi:hypothetical protein
MTVGEREGELGADFSSIVLCPSCTIAMPSCAVAMLCPLGAISMLCLRVPLLRSAFLCHCDAAPSRAIAMLAFLRHRYALPSCALLCSPAPLLCSLDIMFSVVFGLHRP